MAGPTAKVWILEDDAEFRELLDEVLRGAGVELSTFDQPQDLLRELQRGGSPDVLVTDHHLDRAHGLDLVCTLRARGLTFPVVMVTAFSDAALRAAADALPGVELVDKPCDLYALRRRVAALLRAPPR